MMKATIVLIALVGLVAAVNAQTFTFTSTTTSTSTSTSSTTSTSRSSSSSSSTSTTIGFSTSTSTSTSSSTSSSSQFPTSTSSTTSTSTSTSSFAPHNSDETCAILQYNFGGFEETDFEGNVWEAKDVDDAPGAVASEFETIQVYGDIKGNRGHSLREIYRYVLGLKQRGEIIIDPDLTGQGTQDDVLYLYFIEPVAPAGRRVFDILVNDVVVKKNFDIAAEAGGINYGVEVPIELINENVLSSRIILRPVIGKPIIAGMQLRCKETATFSSSSVSQSSQSYSSESTSTSTSTSSSLYQRDWVPAGDIEIMLVDDIPRTLIYAEDDCIQRGGHLLVPHNQQEIDVLVGFYLFDDATPIAWLGGTVTDQSTISWIDGSPYQRNLTPWDDGHPMGTYRRGVFFSAASGEADFRSKRMGLKLNYFCMRDVVPTTVGPSTTLA